MLTPEQIDRIVMADQSRPCIYGAAGPCFHPKCLMSHARAIREKLMKGQPHDPTT